MSRDTVRFDGRVLLLCDDPAALLNQFQGEDLPLESVRLRDRITVDEITPGWVCYYFGQRLEDFPYLGLLCGGTFPIHEGFVRRGGFQVAVSGQRHGIGGPREAAPYAERASGLRLLIAGSFDPVYRQNCHSLGLLTSTDLGLVDRIRRGEAIPIEAFTEGMDELTAEVVRSGGLRAYVRDRLAGRARLPLPGTGPRPMTYGEKILARAARTGQGQAVGLPAVAPGDGLMVQAAWRFSHETVTPLAVAMLRAGLGPDLPFEDPATILAFRDHLSFMGRFYTQDQAQPGLLEVARRIKKMQEDF